MDMIHIHRHVNDFDFHLFAYLTDNPLYRERDRLLDQNLPAIFGEKTIWSVNNETVCQSWRSSLRSMHRATDPTLHTAYEIS